MKKLLKERKCRVCLKKAEYKCACKEVFYCGSPHSKSD